MLPHLQRLLKPSSQCVEHSIEVLSLDAMSPQATAQSCEKSLALATMLMRLVSKNRCKRTNHIHHKALVKCRKVLGISSSPLATCSSVPSKGSTSSINPRRAFIRIPSDCVWLTSAQRKGRFRSLAGKRLRFPADC